MKELAVKKKKRISTVSPRFVFILDSLKRRIMFLKATVCLQKLFLTGLKKSNQPCDLKEVKQTAIASDWQILHRVYHLCRH